MANGNQINNITNPQSLLEIKALLERKKQLISEKTRLSQPKNVGVIEQQAPLGRRVLGKIHQRLPEVGQFAGGFVGTAAGSRVGAPARGGIAGGTAGRMLGRLGQLSIEQFADNPKKFIMEVLNPLPRQGGINAIMRNTTPEQQAAIKTEFLNTLGNEVFFAGLGQVGKGAIKGIAGEFLGERVAERGFESGFKKMTDPKFRNGRVPKEIAVKTGQYFQKLRNVAGKNVSTAVNRQGVGNKLVSKQFLQDGLNEINQTLGSIDGMSVLTAPNQKNILKGIVADVQRDITRSKRGVSIGRLWDIRKNKVDKLMFGRRFSEEATEYLKSVRQLLNNPIRQASPEVAQKITTYSSLFDLIKYTKLFNVSISPVASIIAITGVFLAGIDILVKKEKLISLDHKLASFIANYMTNWINSNKVSFIIHNRHTTDFLDWVYNPIWQIWLFLYSLGLIEAWLC